MIELATSEVHLANIASSFFKGDLNKQTIRPFPKKKKIGPSCETVLKDILTKGFLSFLLNDGGWESRTFLKDGKPFKGRVWERHDFTLSFSPMTLEVLMFLRDSPKNIASFSPQTVGDLLVLYKYSLISKEKGSPLTALLNPENLSEVPESLSFDCLVQNESWVLEFLIGKIVRKWVSLEKKKHEMDLESLILLGKVQDEVMRRFFSSCKKYDRKDLSVIFTEICYWTLNIKKEEIPLSSFWIGKESSKNSLSQRQESRKASGSLLKNLSTIESWAKEEGIVPKWDDRYPVSQCLLTLWRGMNQRLPSQDKNGFQIASSLYKELISM